MIFVFIQCTINGDIKLANESGLIHVYSVGIHRVKGVYPSTTNQYSRLLCHWLQSTLTGNSHIYMYMNN